ncbi:hypothetical protein C8R45DRAFT_1068880 [Mycena sanguinolenta]|nr:hypothetical protein C8R45DRAFT_1068880 [Mycena sanguinolenta]
MYTAGHGALDRSMSRWRGSGGRGWWIGETDTRGSTPFRPLSDLQLLPISVRIHIQSSLVRDAKRTLPSMAYRWCGAAHGCISSPPPPPSTTPRARGKFLPSRGQRRIRIRMYVGVLILVVMVGTSGGFDGADNGVCEQENEESADSRREGGACNRNKANEQKGGDQPRWGNVERIDFVLLPKHHRVHVVLEHADKDREEACGGGGGVRSQRKPSRGLRRFGDSIHGASCEYGSGGSRNAWGAVVEERETCAESGGGSSERAKRQREGVEPRDKEAGGVGWRGTARTPRLRRKKEQWGVAAHAIRWCHRERNCWRYNSARTSKETRLANLCCDSSMSRGVKFERSSGAGAGANRDSKAQEVPDFGSSASS